VTEPSTFHGCYSKVGDLVKILSPTLEDTGTVGMVIDVLDKREIAGPNMLLVLRSDTNTIFWVGDHYVGVIRESR
jgi:hypothetical protein